MLWHAHWTTTDMSKATVLSLFDGRFTISSTELFDTETKTRYVFDDTVALNDLFITNVPEINDMHPRVSVLLLCALAHSPMDKISATTLLDPTSGIEIMTESLSHFTTGRFYYRFSKPVMHAFHTSYAHAVGVSSILVSADGKFRNTSNQEIVPQANNGHVIVATDDKGEVRNYRAAELVAAAWYPDVAGLSPSEIVFADGDESNFNKDNIIVNSTVDTSSVVTREDTDPVYLSFT